MTPPAEPVAEMGERAGTVYMPLLAGPAVGSAARCGTVPLIAELRGVAGILVVPPCGSPMCRMPFRYSRRPNRFRPVFLDLLLERDEFGGSSRRSRTYWAVSISEKTCHPIVATLFMCATFAQACVRASAVANCASLSFLRQHHHRRQPQQQQQPAARRRRDVLTPAKTRPPAATIDVNAFAWERSGRMWRIARSPPRRPLPRAAGSCTARCPPPPAEHLPRPPPAPRPPLSLRPRRRPSSAAKAGHPLVSRARRTATLPSPRRLAPDHDRAERKGPQGVVATPWFCDIDGCPARKAPKSGNG